jgi:acyl-CoA dehydrogenase family protein 9
MSHEDQSVQQAEEILGERLEKGGFAKGLFFGRFDGTMLPAYPDVGADAETTQLVEKLKTYCLEHIDPVAIDRQAEIPPTVVRGLGELGVLGACLPTSVGGLGMSQVGYCQLLEVLGAHCGSTALFVNAHHSIGPRALVLFGTDEHRAKYLPKSASGEWLSAFALTEPEAGSDAANVQTTAIPTEDGRGFLINGEKRWITNGGIAQVLTVMARTPEADNPKGSITAFVVTPDMPGFKVLEARMDKVGVRGTATGRLEFKDMFVPRENVLGQLGQGLKVALTVLDFGRTTFGASCTGAAKFCFEKTVEHANNRIQFDRPLAAFELVREKIAAMAAGVFAMEACTYQTAAIVDADQSEFMIETAMLKVFTTETLWSILDDTIQIHGGKAYFTDQPFERMMRDARINTIGEGANDVLRVFSALVGMRDVGIEMEGVLEAFSHPLTHWANFGKYAGRRVQSLFSSPEVTVFHSQLEAEATRIADGVRLLGSAVDRMLRTHQREIIDLQMVVGRVSDVATELYVSICVLRRMDALLGNENGDPDERKTQLAAGAFYLSTATRRRSQLLHALTHNDDAEAMKLAASVLGS